MDSVKKHCLLVVDDEPDILELISFNLKAEGYQIFTAATGPEALNQARAALERDQAQLEYAQINFTRDQKLFDQKLISQDELDTNRAARDAITGTVAVDKAAITNA